MGTAPTPTNPNFDSGYGFVQANIAATLIPAIIPTAPTLTLASTSIAVGGSTTLTWSSANTTGCTASGSWTGAVDSNGTQTVTPSAVGTDTYMLVCANAAGTSPATSATLTVTAAATPPPATGGGGGGGALGLSTLLGLLALCAARARHWLACVLRLRLS
jgi:hypothetical protein